MPLLTCRQSKPRIAVQPEISGGTNGGTQMSNTNTNTNTQMAGAFGTTTAASSKAVIAVQPTTGGGTNTNTQMSGGSTATTMGATQVVGTMPAGSTVSSGTSGTSATASGLRSKSSHQGGRGTSSQRLSPRIDQNLLPLKTEPKSFPQSFELARKTRNCRLNPLSLHRAMRPLGLKSVQLRCIS